MPNLIGSLQLDGTLTGQLSDTNANLTGFLSNATLRGMPVEIRIDGTILQWKYEDETEWRDIINLATINYSTLSNLPLINGVELVGDKSFEDLGIADEYATKHEGVTDITRDGTTFTVTRADGTTFTFDQQDYDTIYNEATSIESGLMSSSDKAKLDGIESGSQENVIESISVNNATQQILNKNVNIVMPTNVSDLDNDAGYATTTQVNAKIEELAQDVVDAGYQTAADVSDIVESYGYQNAANVESAIESYGYQTVNDVGSIVEAYGYQDATDVVNTVEGYGYQNAQDVADAIATALEGITQISYHVCGYDEYDHNTFLPIVEGEVGVIYLVPKPSTNAAVVGDAIVGQAVVGISGGDAAGGENNNIYIEYIYDGVSFEKIGDTRVDLTDYFNSSDVVSDADVLAMLQEIGIA